MPDELEAIVEIPRGSRNKYEMKHESGEQPMREEIVKVALDAADRVKERRPDIRPVAEDFEWGMLNGKLSALRWMLGEDWDELYT